MKRITITVGQISYAIKLKKLLKREGIFARQIKVDNTDDNKGCSHGVEISEEDFLRSVVIMRENNIEYKIYNGKNNIS